MSKTTNRSGYVLILALMSLTLVISIVTLLATKGRVHVRYLKTMIDREQAKMLAWSGVQVGISQLATMDEVEKKQQEQKPTPPAAKQQQQQQQKQEASPDEKARQTVITLLPVINRWQEFTLKQTNDGVDGVIKICIGCEQGKLDLHEIFDFEKKKFFGEGAQKNDYKKLLQLVCKNIEKRLDVKDLFKAFEKFLKERQNKLYDPTELLNVERFKTFGDQIFYEPAGKERKEGAQQKQTIYLHDIFTLWSFQKELNPLLLSHSLQQLLGLESQSKDGKQLDKKELEKSLKLFKRTLSWPKDWNSMFKPLYGKTFEQIPKEVREAMSPKFEPSVFSVLSYGTVGEVTQRLLVILERTQSSTTDSSGKKSTSFEFRAKKFYWL